MRAALYVRIITNDTFDHTRLQGHLNGCRRFAAHEGLDVAYEVTNTVSGPLRQRPGGAFLIDLIEDDQIDAVVVTTIGAISRLPDDLDWFSQLCEQHGIQLISALEGCSQRERAVGESAPPGSFPA